MRRVRAALLAAWVGLVVGCGTQGGASPGGATGAVSSARSTGDKENSTMAIANEVIERLRRGEPFKRGVEAFLRPDGTPDPAGLAEIAEALRTTPEPAREGLVRLLVAIGRQVDPLRKAGGNLLRDPAVIALLVTPGLAVPGGGRDHALDALEASTPRELLAPHHEAIAKDLEERPGTSALSLVAKAKPPQAKDVVDKLAGSPSFAGSEALDVAKAALGDTAVEKRLVDAFLATQVPEEKIRLAAVLGRVATPAALSALASEMRTDLVYEMPAVMMRSVRLDILAAISKSYPDRPLLWDNAISSDEDYAKIEAFLETTFGTKWKKPRPPYLTIQGFPSHPQE